MLKLHTLKPKKGSKFTSRRIGRGPGSGRGKTPVRAARVRRPARAARKGLRALGMKMIIRRIPKLRGFKSHHAKDETITLGELQTAFPQGGIVTRAELAKRGVISGQRARSRSSASSSSSQADAQGTQGLGRRQSGDREGWRFDCLDIIDAVDCHLCGQILPALETEGPPRQHPQGAGHPGHLPHRRAHPDSGRRFGEPPELLPSRTSCSA